MKNSDEKIRETEVKENSRESDPVKFYDAWEQRFKDKRYHKRISE